MPRPIRERLTYANVMATLAVFIALGGSSYAALKIGSREIRDGAVRSVDLRNNDVRGKDVRNRSLTGADLKLNSLGGGSVKESRLGKVPSAANADRVGGRSADELKVRCPAGTLFKAGVCLEGEASRPVDYGAAGDTCQFRGRQLPPYVVLKELFDDGTASIAPGGEFTSDVFESRDVNDQLDAVVIATQGGNVTYTKAISPITKAYRCMAQPGN